MKGDLYITGGTVLTLSSENEILEDGVIGIRDGKIFYIESDPDFIVPKEAKSINADSCLVLPGFINGHTHIGMGLLRGVAEDLPLERWLNEVIFPVESQFAEPEFYRLGSYLSLCELIRMGVTTINNMDYFGDVIGEAMHEGGVRGYSGTTISETGHVQDNWTEMEKVLDSLCTKLEPFPLVSPIVTPHSVYAVSKKNLQRAQKIANQRNLPIHIHLSETELEVTNCFEQNGKRPPAYLESLGFFERPLILAHCACVNDAEIKSLSKPNVGVIHNPDSNMKLGTKICPLSKFRKAGAQLGYGTDGVASNNRLDLLQAAGLSSKLQSYLVEPGILATEDAVRMLTIEGAKALGLSEEVGSLEVGKAADIICINTNSPHAIPIYDPYSHLVFSASGHDVKHTLVNGKILMEDRVIKTLDEKDTLIQGKKWGARIRDALNTK